jgi:hypothetical protein
MYALGTSEYNAYLIIDEQACKERGDDLESDGGGVLVIFDPHVLRVGAVMLLPLLGFGPWVGIDWAHDVLSEGFNIAWEPLWGSASSKSKVGVNVGVDMGVNVDVNLVVDMVVNIIFDAGVDTCLKAEVGVCSSWVW